MWAKGLARARDRNLRNLGLARTLGACKEEADRRVGSGTSIFESKRLILYEHLPLF